MYEYWTVARLQMGCDTI